jgi:hypothetical protein
MALAAATAAARCWCLHGWLWVAHGLIKQAQWEVTQHRALPQLHQHTPLTALVFRQVTELQASQQGDTGRLAPSTVQGSEQPACRLLEPQFCMLCCAAVLLGWLGRGVTCSLTFDIALYLMYTAPVTAAMLSTPVTCKSNEQHSQSLLPGPRALISSITSVPVTTAQ